MVRIRVPGDYPLVELDLPAGELAADVVDALREIGDQRRAWRATSIARWDAAAELGVGRKAFDALAAKHGVHPGRFGRFARSDVTKLRRRIDE